MTVHTAQADIQTTTTDQRLAAIFEIARILATEQDLETMLERFLACLIKSLMAAETGILQLYDASTERLRVTCAQGYDLTTLKQISLTPGEAMGGTAFHTGQPTLYPDPQAIAAARENLRPENRELFRVATTSLQPALNAVCIPLTIGQTKVGALILENRGRPGHFVREDLPFLQAVADLIALSIENVRLRKELQATRALEEANRLKAELISILAHEMRTPLTSIKGYSTALLMEEATFDPETQQEFLHIIDEECDILQDLIHDLLESSIIDAGLLKLEPQPVMLPRVARDVVDDVMHRTQKHHFLVDFPDRFPIVDADPQRVEQVLRNLVDNAVKYSPQGGLVVVRGEVGEDEVTIGVADQGVGIAPEHLNRLFEKFFRVESGLGRHVVGSGLGLPISRTIVEGHGGRIWAESQVGEGTVLYFTLPLKGLSQERPTQEEQQHE
jgi:signal transduction histidine kinase